VADAARALVGHAWTAPPDALAARALAAAGTAAQGTRKALRAVTETQRGAPVPGDLLFFDSGPIGVVTDADSSGRASFAYAQRGRVRTGFLTLARPGARRSRNGPILNTFMAPKRRNERPGTRHLASELLAEIRSPVAR
jgi:hypothetical protein